MKRSLPFPSPEPGVWTLRAIRSLAPRAHAVLDAWRGVAAGMAVLGAAMAFPHSAHAQCGNSTTEQTPAQNVASVAQGGCLASFSHRRDRHRVVDNFTVGDRYTISASGAAATFVTVWSGSLGGTLVAHGAITNDGILPFTATATTLYFNVNSNASCGTTISSANLTICRLCPVPAYAVYNGTSHTEGFESWVNYCGRDSAAPSANWSITPPTGNASWRRDDQGSTAGWTRPADGMYNPASAEGARSARWHANNADNGDVGTLDLYIDMSAATGPSHLRFSYINGGSSGNGDNLTVWQSTDGGGSFTQLGARLDESAGNTWETILRTITSTSATTVIRFRATATSIINNNDIGIDDLRILPPCGPAYAAFPYTEDFESWQELCAITTVPGPNWWNAPFSGHASWRRNDQPPSSGYTPPASLGSFSARWQASQAGNGEFGDLDLHIDMSTASGPSELRFDHIWGGSFVQLREALLVYVSEDGGANFTMVGDTITWPGPSFWTPAVRTITSTSATTVIRLRARRIAAASSNGDIGVDNLRVVACSAPNPCAGIPGLNAAAWQARWLGQDADGSHLIVVTGAAVQGWEALDATGRVVATETGRHPRTTDGRFRVVLPGQGSGLHVVRVRTDHGMTTVRLMHAR